MKDTFFYFYFNLFSFIFQLAGGLSDVNQSKIHVHKYTYAHARKHIDFPSNLLKLNAACFSYLYFYDSEKIIYVTPPEKKYGVLAIWFVVKTNKQTNKKKKKTKTKPAI